ncbi:MAG: thiamine phosphate synthase [Deltaproteobacteria bacterium]|nr:thiamine phosphate synthase [Deltaproteobacteria bacterium]
MQLRYKAGSSHARLACAIAMEQAAAGDLAVVVNDDIAVARTARTGLHLGQMDGDPRGVRDVLGDRALLGWSTHNLAQVDVAATLPVDYLGFGPVRATQTKRSSDPVTGWAMLADACGRARVPVVAIGGMQVQDAAIARSAGAAAMAVVGAWLRDGERVRAVAEAEDALTLLVHAWNAG